MLPDDRTLSNNMLIGGAAVASFLLAAALLFVPIETPSMHEPTEVDTFASEAAFKSYLASADNTGTATESRRAVDHADEYSGESGGVTEGAPDHETSADASAPMAGDGTETTVQVAGVDEPDFVKTDGDHLFYAGNRWRHSVNTTVISNLPDMELSANISERGDLLLHDDVLVVLEDDAVTAYRIADGEASQLWTEELEHGVKTARMVEGQLVLVLSNRVNPDSPCPIRPMAGVSMPCTSIYRPGFSVPVDATYSVVKMDAASGDVTDETAFVGSPRAEVYVTGSNVYVAYTESEQRSDVLMDFLLNHASIDAETRDRLQTVDSYELSERARNAEIEHIMQNWISENEDREESIENEIEQYIEDRKRDIETTTIIRINSDMEPDGEETLPGRVMDRMHLHEHGGQLAALTRINPRGFPADTTNDLVTFGENMEQVDSVEGITDGWLNHARFLGDRLYMTENDQLHVYGLDDGSRTAQFDREVDYVHALDGDRVLAIGQKVFERSINPETYGDDLTAEEKERLAERVYHRRNLSVSILNIAEETVEAESVLDQSWSRASHDLHAFQLDTQREQFFLPSHSQSYVGDYSDGLAMHTVNATGASRAFFIGDHLYTVSRNDIRAFTVAEQERASTLIFPEQERKPRPYPEPVIEHDSND